jgi:hypothetical protein
MEGNKSSLNLLQVQYFCHVIIQYKDGEMVTGRQAATGMELWRLAKKKSFDWITKQLLKNPDLWRGEDVELMELD